jgi:hypothetical protein
MPSEVICDNRHWGGRCLEAARKIARDGSLGACSRCGIPIRYIMTHTYPNKGTYKFELERVIRLYADEEAEREGYDPMLFFLRQLNGDEPRVQLFYWTKNKHNAWHVGQFPPLLSIEEFGRLHKNLFTINS